MPTLAEVRARKPERPTTSVDLCLDPALAERMYELDSRREALANSSRAAKMATKVEMNALAAEYKELQSLAVDESGTLTVRATWSMGEWQQFVDANPPRTGEGPAKERDDRRAGGVVNSDALLEVLSQFAYAWDGEPLASDDWDERFVPAIWPGNLRDVTLAVVSLYEAARDFRLVRSALSDALGALSDSAVRGTSGSARSGTPAGSRSKSSGATTKKAAK